MHGQSVKPKRLLRNSASGRVEATHSAPADKAAPQPPLKLELRDAWKPSGAKPTLGTPRPRVRSTRTVTIVTSARAECEGQTDESAIRVIATRRLRLAFRSPSTRRESRRAGSSTGPPRTIARPHQVSSAVRSAIRRLLPQQSRYSRDDQQVDIRVRVAAIGPPPPPPGSRETASSTSTRGSPSSPAGTHRASRAGRSEVPATAQSVARSGMSPVGSRQPRPRSSARRAARLSAAKGTQMSIAI